MANDFVTPREMAKRVVAVINKHADKYQKESGCSDDKKNHLAHAILYGSLGGFFMGPERKKK